MASPMLCSVANQLGISPGVWGDDFGHRGGYDRAGLSVDTANRANAPGPVGSSDCQGSQAVRVAWFATTSLR